MAWTGHAGAAGPTRRNRNRSGIARSVRVETAVADRRPLDVARPGARLGRSLPAPLRAHCDADVRTFKLWSRRAGPGTRGQPQMPMNAMVAITRTAQAAAPSLSHGTQGSRRAGVSVGSGVSQLGLVLSISPVTVLSLSSQCDLSSRED